MKRSYLLGIAYVVSVSIALAQTTSTSILGTVTDASSASIAGAKVTATNVNTRVASNTVTTDTGDYAFPLLDIGEYQVSVDQPGFKGETRKGITLQVNDKFRVDFHLQVGSQSERVTVTAEAANLQTDEASIGGTVEQRRLVELPMNGRNVGNFAVLNPGVSFGSRHGYDGQSGGGGGVPIPGQTIAIIANGQREVSQHATLDGVVATEARVNTVPFSPSPEAMEEVRVISGSYSAEYGFNSGAQLVMVMRSGTNDLHGSAYNFLRNDKLDAENFFQNYFTPAGQPRVKKTSLRQNQFGFVVGGPVMIPKLYNGRNKTFFNFNYEGRRRREPGAIATALVPSDAFRNGDFSALLNRRSAAGAALPAIQLFDPSSDPASPTPFPGNIIPSSRISPTAKALLEFFPRAQNDLSDPITGINFRNPGTNSIDDNQYFVKIDHSFSANDKVFARYASNIPKYFSITNNPAFSYLVEGRNNNLATQWLHLFSPTIVNEARFGISESRDDSFNPRANTNFTLEGIGIRGFNVLTDGNRPLTSREVGIPAMNIQGFFSPAERDGGNGFDRNRVYQINDNVAITTGAHTIKAGFDYRRVTLFRGAANVPRGGFNFAGNVSGSSVAAFLLGAPTSTDSPEGLPLTDILQHRSALYINDDWKPFRRLTLNLGLRWEYNSPATDVQGLWRSAEWRNGRNRPPEYVPADIRTVYQFYKASKKQFMPRIGLAYRLTDSWVIRSAFGIYYNVHQLNNYSILNLNPPLSGSSSFANTISNGVFVPGAPVYNFSNPFGTPSPTSLTNANVLTLDNFQPYVAQWSFDIQRRLPWDATISVGYVGSKTTHLDNTIELNNPDPFIPSGATDTIQSRRPYPFIVDKGVTRPLSRIRFLDSGGNSWYDGLQVSLRKRYSHGVVLTFAYTWSKTLMQGYGRNEGDGINSNTYQNKFDRASEKGRVGFDASHVAVSSFIYDLPAPKMLSSGIAGAVFAGWQANGIITLRSGLPFTVTQGNIINTGNAPVRPDRIGSGKLDNPTVNQWFNPDAFQLVSCSSSALQERCHYGNSGTGILEGPGFKNVDASLFKNFKITERAKLQFRSEFFNVFNTPQFNVPNRGLNTGGGFLPQRAAGGAITFPSQAGITSGPGAITSLIAPMRNIQFGLKLLW
ncbi:MAG: carboxypeptidase regulatory-like domain-containing protein [Bryobacteraceae bacterium]|nr:carboxypeptidase regulatory-like domain-containing protein [Bryobacteraceae bacterium]